ncbi:MAG: hypothetical protein KKA73_24940 [Chloroflexi bacterium]|nr:hypothetical protein [Chloroflexota bacterium]MBU1750943.1 hypothetical protein [Chloroflexota bacterium]
MNLRGLAAGAAILLVSLILASGIVLSGQTRSAAAKPRLIVDESVGTDLQVLAQDTWDQFLTAFAGRAGCLSDVRLRASYDLDSRGDYDPATATVTVRVPGTRAMLQSALLHEWAHHIEFQCPAHQELRPAFLSAQRLAPDTPWRPADASADLPASEWAAIPSEQYAEAVIELVLGSRPIPTLAHVTPEAVQVIQQWATGE